MRLDVPNAFYKHAVKRVRQPRVRPTQLLRTFSSSIHKGNDDADNSRDPPDPTVQDLAVLGGGITGLASAFFLSREMPNAKITIFEKSARLGGWVDSERIPVGNDSILFEWGPRTVRSSLTAPASRAMIDLVCTLPTIMSPILLNPCGPDLRA